MKYELTNMEEIVMKCIWDLKDEPSIVVGTILKMVNERYQRNWKIQTISTYVAHLVRKGYVTMQRDGRIYSYTAVLSEREYLTEKIRAQEAFWGREYYRSCMGA